MKEFNPEWTEEELLDCAGEASAFYMKWGKMGVEQILEIARMEEDDEFDEATEENVFAFLEELRQSGVTNMFFAAPYIEEEFGISKAEAKRYLLDWINSFKK